MSETGIFGMMLLFAASWPVASCSPGRHLVCLVFLQGWWSSQWWILHLKDSSLTNLDQYAGIYPKATFKTVWTMLVYDSNLTNLARFAKPPKASWKLGLCSAFFFFFLFGSILDVFSDEGVFVVFQCEVWQEADVCELPGGAEESPALWPADCALACPRVSRPQCLVELTVTSSIVSSRGGLTEVDVQ